MKQQESTIKESVDFAEEQQHARAASASSAKAARPKQHKLPKNIDISMLDGLKPPQTTFWDDPANTRLRVYTGPTRKGTSENYSVVSKSDACKGLLEWCWRRHTATTGEPCPWKF